MQGINQVFLVAPAVGQHGAEDGPHRAPQEKGRHQFAGVQGIAL